MKHTPGPWVVGEIMKFGRGIRSIPIENNEGYVVAEAEYMSDHQGLRERTMSNANLIAAAPDLLEALKNIVGDKAIKNWYETASMGASSRDRYEAARAAIAKAEGVTNG